jgi:hypothetical protein
MRHVALVVEGQTEEQFVKRILDPWAYKYDTYLQPIIVKTSQVKNQPARRGGGRWKHYEPLIRRVLSSSHLSLVTTLIDFYGYPPDAPGAQCPSPHQPRECASLRETEMARAINDQRFLPNVALHEFETWVIAAAVATGSFLGNTDIATKLQRAVAEAGGEAELVDDAPATSPSHRIYDVKPDFLKTTEGIAAIESAGLQAVAAACPKLRVWLDRLVTDDGS